MIKKIIYSMGVLSIGMASGFAGELTAYMNMQIDLKPSCEVNGKRYSGDVSGLDFGTLDFGEAAANQGGTVNTSLTNNHGNRINIRCSGTNNFKVIFGAGKHDGRVPANQQANYFRAMSNGNSYVAYNLLYGPNKTVQKPQSSVSLASNNTQHAVELYAQATLAGNNVTSGEYSDSIAITIEF